MNIYNLVNTLSNLALFIGCPLIVLVPFLRYLYHKNNNREVQRHASLKTAKKKEAKGIIFGLRRSKEVYSPSDTEGHVIVVAPTGGGKTTTQVIPTLKAWEGHFFAIDISGDICKNIGSTQKMIYEPSNSESTPYNIFGAIDQMDNDNDKNEALELLAFLMMPEDVRITDTAKFFLTEGRKILTASLIAFYHKGMDFIPICETIVRSSWKTLFNRISRTENGKAIQYITSFEGTSEQNTAGCKQCCDSALKLFATNDGIKATIRRPCEEEAAFTPVKLEEVSAVVVVEDSKLKLMSPLLHIIVAQSMEYFSNRSNDSQTQILFCLDEFVSLGKMEMLDALRKLRKKHIRIMILTQSIIDIDLIYGKEERMAMMTNFKYKVILGADDTDTQEYFAKLIGEKEVKKKSTSRNSKTITHTLSEDKEYAIEPAQLARLGEDLILLHPEGYMRLKKNYFFKD